MVSRDECMEFIAKLNKLTKRNFRLPTEAEWEFAARGGNKSQGYTYSGSNTLDDVAWNSENSGGTTHEVGTKNPNELGLFDMNGNVKEWCKDFYGANYYSESVYYNPAGPSGILNVVRGGDWNTRGRGCSNTIRGGCQSANAMNSLGLRLAL